MKKLSLPDSHTIKTTIDNDISEFDLSYSNEIKEFLAEQMDIDVNDFKELTCAYFTNIKQTNGFIIKDVGSPKIAGCFKPINNLLLVSIDCTDIEYSARTIIHEAAHFLCLNNSVSLAEACALIHEKKWAKKNNKLDEFNRDYYFVETYMKSFILLNMIKESVFNNDDLEFKKYTK